MKTITYFWLVANRKFWPEIKFLTQYLKTPLSGVSGTLFYEWKMRLETNKFWAHLDLWRKFHDIKLRKQSFRIEKDKNKKSS